jgi:hypothetical protein
MRRKETAVVGQPIRLSRDLDTFKRKYKAIRTNVPMKDRRAFVFNDAEIAVLKRMDRGEQVPEVVLPLDINRVRWAKMNLAWPDDYDYGGEGA